MLSFSTTEPHSVVAASRCFSSACLLFTFSIDFAHALCAAGRPLCGSMTGALGRNDDRQVRDWHPLAVEDQTLGRVSAGRTSEGVTLNAAYRRPIEANFRQEHLGAARQTFHICPWPPVADTLMKPTLRPSEVAPYRCGSLLGRGSEPCPLQGPSDLTYGHIALPPRGSKRLGPRYWAGDSSDWLKLKNSGAPAVRRGPRKTV